MGKKWVIEQRRNKESKYYLSELEATARKKRILGLNKLRTKYSLKKLNERKERCGLYGKKFWTKVEKNYLIKNYKEKSIEYMAKKLKRSYCSVAQKLRVLKLRKNHKWI